MRLLVAAATSFEVDGLTDYLQREFTPQGAGRFTRKQLEVVLCITGVGTLQSVYHLQETILAFEPHFCLQLGVAGAFGHERALGSLVIVREEIMGDLGVDDLGRYRDMFEIGLIAENQAPFSGKKLVNTFQDFPFRLNLPFVTGITVNTVSGSEALIRQRAEYYEADVESMEGAAFHYVCLRRQVPFLQVRAISNYVEPRDRSRWEMKAAIDKLNEWAIGNLSAL